MSSVSRIVLEIGQLSGVEIGALEFAFEVFKKGSRMEKAAIEYQTPPLLLYCRECENEYIADFEDLRCPACMEAGFDILQGQELRVKSIEGEADGG